MTTGTSSARATRAGAAPTTRTTSAGRIVAEDFSPCLISQQAYSTPNLTTGDGTEAYYEYDGLDPDPTAGSIPNFPINTALLLGRLVAVADRGAKTVTSYDGRGRVLGMAREMAAPGTPSDTMEERYAQHWYVTTTTYDGADRPVTTTTGVDQLNSDADPGRIARPERQQRRDHGVLAARDGQQRELRVRTRSSRASRGPPTVPSTRSSTATWPARRAAFRLRLAPPPRRAYRPTAGRPAIWSQQPPAYTPAPNPTGPPDTFQLLLQDLSYSTTRSTTRPTIRDFRNPAEWPAGAQPVTRTIQYDDLYRVINVAYSYPGGTDPWTSPFYAEDNGVDPDPRRGQPSPHVQFNNRVLSQSFQYDWLGNTTSSDDDAHGFYDRSLGTMTNGTATAGPYQLQAAQGEAG